MKQNRILEPLGEETARAAVCAEELFAPRLEPADGIAEGALHLAHDLHDEMQMVGHHRAEERPDLGRERAEAEKKAEDRLAEARLRDPGLDPFGRNRRPACGM